jgi:alpha-tubulin suppressor-like RCC1 family protein
VLTLKKIEFSRVPLNEKIVQLSCGMEHCIAKTSLRKVFAWGNNSHGQLGLGHFRRVKKPKLIDSLKSNIVIQQVASTAFGSVALDSNGHLFWWGTNGSIFHCNLPREVLLFEKVIS